MKFLPKCRTKKLGTIYTILESVCLYLNWEGADIQSQGRLKKIPGPNYHQGYAILGVQHLKSECAMT